MSTSYGSYGEGGQSSGPVIISDVQYKGEEYVTLTNTGEATVDLAGWILRDKNDANQEYTFGAGAELAAGASLEVYTKAGHEYSFNSARPIWHDKGDELELLNAAGAVASYYAYGDHVKAAPIASTILIPTGERPAERSTYAEVF